MDSQKRKNKSTKSSTKSLFIVFSNLPNLLSGGALSNNKLLMQRDNAPKAARNEMSRRIIAGGEEYKNISGKLKSFKKPSI
jgi:hypothetical protein